MQIVTDSAADLTREEILKFNIEVAPLFIQFPESEIKSSEISIDNFFKRLESMKPNIPKTAQPSPGIFANIYRKVAETDKKILSIHISSKLSGAINSARAGAAQLKDIEISFFDTLSLSPGQRFHVLSAAKAIQAGWSLHKTLKLLKNIRESIEVIFTLDTLKYLAKGGRIGRVQSIAASLLNIKPLIRVDSDGAYSPAGRARSLTNAIRDIVGHIQSKFSSEEPIWVTVVHGKCPEYAELLAKELKNTFNVSLLEIIRVSPVLAVHTGPMMVGVGILPVKILSELGDIKS